MAEETAELSVSISFKVSLTPQALKQFLTKFEDSVFSQTAEIFIDNMYIFLYRCLSFLVDHYILK